MHTVPSPSSQHTPPLLLRCSALLPFAVIAGGEGRGGEKHSCGYGAANAGGQTARRLGLPLTLALRARVCVCALVWFLFHFAWPFCLTGLPCHFPSRPPFCPFFYHTSTSTQLFVLVGLLVWGFGALLLSLCPCLALTTPVLSLHLFSPPLSSYVSSLPHLLGCALGFISPPVPCVNLALVVSCLFYCFFSLFLRWCLSLWYLARVLPPQRDRRGH